MARLIAFNAIFFLLPFGLYAAWLFATRGTVGSASDWPLRTIAWLAIGGAVLMIAAILVFIQFDAQPTNDCAEIVAAQGLDPATPCKRVYVPAKVVDGVLTPGHFELVPDIDP